MKMQTKLLKKLTKTPYKRKEFMIIFFVMVV